VALWPWLFSGATPRRPSRPAAGALIGDRAALWQASPLFTSSAHAAGGFAAGGFLLFWRSHKGEQ